MEVGGEDSVMIGQGFIRDILHVLNAMEWMRMISIFKLF